MAVSAPPSAKPGVPFDAFLSYSHAADGLLAPRLQAGLQSFAKPWWKRRVMRVFRDEASLSANPHLWSSITSALDASEWFIPLLSPEAAGSEWVNREVEYWLATRERERILPVLTEGEFVWDETVNALDPVHTTVAPPALLAAFSEEPRWVDLRWARDDTDLDLRNSRFRGAVADVASAIRGVPKDDLESEEVRQHRRTVRTAWGAGLALAALTVAASGAAVYANDQRQEAETQRAVAEDQARIAEARGLAAQAVALVPTRLDLSLLLAVEGLRTDDSLQTQSGLLNALNGAQHLVGFQPGLPVPELLAGAPEAGVVAIYDGADISLWDAESWTPARSTITPPASSTILLLSGDGSRVVGMSDDRVLIWDTETGEQIGPPLSIEGGTDFSTAVDVSWDGSLVALSNIDAPYLDVSVFRVDDGSLVGRFDLGEEQANTFGFGVFSYDGASIVLSQNNEVGVFDVASGEVVTPITTLVEVAEYSVFSPTGEVIAVTSLIPGAITLVEASTLTPTLPLLRPASGGRIYNVLFSPDGARLAVLTDDGAVTVFDVGDGQVVATLTGPTGVPAGFSWLDNSRLALGTDTGVTEWDLRRVSVLTNSQTFDSYLAFPDVDFVEAGHLMSAAGTLNYSINGVEKTLTLEGECPRIKASPDASLVALGCTDGETRTVEVMDLATEEPTFRTEQYPGAWDFEWSPDGKSLGILTGVGAVVLDALTGDVLMPERQLDTRFLGAMAWTPTGDHLLVGGQQGELIFLDTDTWDETNRLALETTQLALFDFAIHPDGRRLYASSEAGRVWVIDLTTIEIEGDPLDASGTQLQEIAISPNGVYVAAISRDGALRTWETESRRSVGPAMIGHAFAARGLEWGPDGPVSLGMDGAEPDGLGHFTVVEWNLAPNYLVEVACGLVGRNMSLAEWAEYVPGADYRPTCPNLASP